MGLGRRLRRQIKREALATQEATQNMDERMLLLTRLGQKDAQLFQMELNYNNAVQEINRLNEALAKYAPVEKEELKVDAVEVVEAKDVPNSKVDQASER